MLLLILPPPLAWVGQVQMSATGVTERQAALLPPHD